MVSNGRLSVRQGGSQEMHRSTRFAREWFRHVTGQEEDTLLGMQRLSVVHVASEVRAMLLTGYRLVGHIT